MKTNSKVKNFENKVSQLVIENKASIMKSVANDLANFEKIDFTVFSNEKPYQGEFKNKIFFTYNNHYRANSGVWMAVGKLNHPHMSYEDRGYIKGVATDLDGYMKLRWANALSHNLDCTYGIYYPRFQKSLNQKKYQNQCDAIVSKAIAELNQFIEDQKVVLNQKLRDITGCSLLHYLRDIF